MQGDRVRGREPYGGQGLELQPYFQPSPLAPHSITLALTEPQFALRLAAKGEVTLTLGRPSKHWLPYVKVT